MFLSLCLAPSPFLNLSLSFSQLFYSLSKLFTPTFSLLFLSLFLAVSLTHTHTHTHTLTLSSSTTWPLDHPNLHSGYLTPHPNIVSPPSTHPPPTLPSAPTNPSTNPTYSQSLLQPFQWLTYYHLH